MLPKIKLLAYKWKVYLSHKFEFLGFNVMLSFNLHKKYNYYIMMNELLKLHFTKAFLIRSVYGETYHAHDAMSSIGVMIVTSYRGHIKWIVLGVWFMFSLWDKIECWNDGLGLLVTNGIRVWKGVFSETRACRKETKERWLYTFIFYISIGSLIGSWWALPIMLPLMAVAFNISLARLWLFETTSLKRLV